MSDGVVELCDICGLPLDDDRPWQRGLEEGGAHIDCLEALEPDEEEEERDD